jgi:pyridoxamine 5'-phosphate oxidase
MTHDPLSMFLAWYGDVERAKVAQPEAMMLATASEDGRPSLRTVLYRPGHDGGIRFFTNYEGRKAQELAENPRAAVLFYWHALQRQVRAEGIASKTSEQESDEYFASRPRLSQLAAWVSPQSRPIGDLAVLDREVVELDVKYRDRPVPRPPFWGGFRLDPDRWESWTGREHRLHERVLFVKSEGDWIRSLIGP